MDICYLADMEARICRGTGGILIALFKLTSGVTLGRFLTLFFLQYGCCEYICPIFLSLMASFVVC